jgi:hypothetical protein
MRQWTRHATCCPQRKLIPGRRPSGLTAQPLPNRPCLCPGRTAGQRECGRGRAGHSWPSLRQGLHLARPWEADPQPGGGPAAGDPGRPPAQRAASQPGRACPSTPAPFPLGIGRPRPVRSLVERSTGLVLAARDYSWANWIETACQPRSAPPLTRRVNPRPTVV